MFDWVWLSRIALLGVVGTAALTTLLSPFSSKSESHNSESRQVITITPEDTEVLELALPSLESPVSLSPPEQKVEGEQQAPVPSFDLNQGLVALSPIFATPVSLGMVAIGTAEGNYRVSIEQGTLYVEQTALYFGHTDPGNLSWGDVVTNYGPCSDQGRSGGNIALAEQLCLQRALSRLPAHLADLDAVGINPIVDLEALLNTADLYNQASPIHSRKLPQALVIARKGGLTGVDALAWARTASFYLNQNQELDLERGENQASGLLGICARERRGITEWQCVYNDQLRRVKAISDVLRKYLKVAQS
ncbi:hypothetical protein [Lyngbya aestuarii]|uniref:hypothetical protein n=1 Tax=Lyngbya aestuarii TaxID=118322 RepID=UPI00403DF3A4